MYFLNKFHLYNHVLVFLNLVLSWTLFSASPVAFPPLGLFSNPLILFSSYLSIRSCSYVLSVPIFYSQIVLFPLHPFDDLTLCILHQLVGRIFDYYFGSFTFLVFLNSVPVFFKSCLSPIFFYLFLLFVLSNSSAVVFLFSCFFLYIFFLSISILLSQFLYLSF